MSEITLAIESPRQADVARLLEALDAYQSSLYPPESNHGELKRMLEALGLYRSAGFVEREAFGDYKRDPLSVFMEKRL